MDHAEAADLTAFDELARRFADRDLAAATLDNDHYPFDPFPHELWQQAAELGLADVTVPESLGGLGQGMSALCTVLRALATADGSMAALILSQAHARHLIASLAEPAHAQRLLSATHNDAPALFATALYDDPQDMSAGLRATTRGGRTRLEGRLDYLICLPTARYAVVPAHLHEEGRHALFVLDLQADGVQVSEPVLGLGLKACPAGDLVVDASVDADCQLGDETGFDTYRAVTETARLGIVATALGVLQGSYKLALDYAQERHQARKMIIEHHMVRQMLAGMVSWIDVGSAALEQALADEERGVSTNASRALSIHEVVLGGVTRATTDGVQVLGGNGYMHEYGQEKRMRDAKQLQAMLGASPTRRMDILERALQRPGA